MGSTPGWGAKIPHASGQTRALQEKPENCNKRSPQAPQLEKAHPLQRRLSAAQKKKKKTLHALIHLDLLIICKAGIYIPTMQRKSRFRDA